MASSQYQLLLGSLNRVRKVPVHGDLIEAHRADCPACSGHAAPLSVALKNDGMVLINCFAGCDPAAILSAVGMSINDLMPANDHHTHSAKGLQKTSAWLSAAALADAVAWAAGLVAADPSEKNLGILVVATHQFQQAARRAMKN